MTRRLFIAHHLPEKKLTRTYVVMTLRFLHARKRERKCCDCITVINPDGAALNDMFDNVWPLRPIA